MELSDFKCTFVITEKVKQSHLSHVGTHLKTIEFLAYPEDEKLLLLNIYKSTLSKPKFFATILL